MVGEDTITMGCGLRRLDKTLNICVLLFVYTTPSFSIKDSIDDFEQITTPAPCPPLGGRKRSMFFDFF
jgi:hypothetical protein